MKGSTQRLFLPNVPPCPSFLELLSLFFKISGRQLWIIMKKINWLEWWNFTALLKAFQRWPLLSFYIFELAITKLWGRTMRHIFQATWCKRRFFFTFSISIHKADKGNHFGKELLRIWLPWIWGLHHCSLGTPTSAPPSSPRSISACLRWLFWTGVDFVFFLCHLSTIPFHPGLSDNLSLSHGLWCVILKAYYL